MSAPKLRYRSGQVSCAVFEHEREDYMDVSFSFQKSYKDKSGEWKNVSSFNLRDIANLLIICTKILMDKVKVEKMERQVDHKIEENDNFDEIPF